MSENDNSAPDPAELIEENRQLKRQLQTFLALFSSTGDFTYTFDREKRFLFANQALLDLWGLTLEDVAGKNFDDLEYPQELADKLNEDIEKVFATQQSVSGQIFYVSPRGRAGYYEHIFSPLFSADGTVETVVGSSRDITARRRRETNRAFLAQIHDDFTRLTTSDEIMQAVGAKIGAFMNVPYCHFMAIDETRDEVEYLARWNAEGVLPLPDKVRLSEQITEDFRQLAYRGETVASADTGANPITRGTANAAINAIAFITVPFLKNGEWKYQFSVHDSRPREWRTDEIELVREIADQIFPRIERSRAEEELRRSEEKYRKLFDSIDEGFCVIEVLFDENEKPADYRFVEVNSAFEAQSGLQNVNNRRMLEFVSSIEEHWLANYGKVALTGEPVRFANEYKSLNRWFDVYAFRIGQPEERKIAVLFNDVTERRQHEKALHRSEERYRTLFNSIDQGFCLIKMIFEKGGKPIDYRFLEINAVFANLTGLPETDVLEGKTAREMIPDLEEKWFEVYGKVALTGEPVKFIDGSEAMGRWFEVYAFRAGESEEKQVAVLFNDITERKLAELERENSRRELENERARLAYIFENAPAFVMVLRGPEHVCEIINPMYQQLIGNRDVIGKTIREALPDLIGQGYFELLDQVYETGEPYIGRESAVEFQSAPHSPIEKRFVDFALQPMLEADNSISGIFVHGVDITDQVEARRTAEEANRLKDEFLATLSHELRTPLAAILGWSKILLDHNIGAAQTRKAIETIDRNARSQKQLIEDILDVSRIISGKLRLDVRAVDLAEVIKAAVETARPGIEAKSIRLQTLLDPEATGISGDPERLQQVVWNLLSNALKFTDKGGRIQVRLERINSHIELTVADTGNGIAAEFIPYVFDRFRQSDGSMTRRQGGLGLGLAIVRQIVELHGGTVAVTSRGLGEGTTFTVSLPLLPARYEPDDDAARVHPTVEIARENAPDNIRELDGRHILVVDNEADSRILLRMMLELSGAKITEAGSAAEALTLLEAGSFDVIISDIGMPLEDGFSLIGKVRKLPAAQGGTTPAVALTAYARSEDRIRAMRAGFQMHVAKPVDQAELVAVLITLAGK